MSRFKRTPISDNEGKDSQAKSSLPRSSFSQRFKGENAPPIDPLLAELNEPDIDEYGLKRKNEISKGMKGYSQFQDDGEEIDQEALKIFEQAQKPYHQRENEHYVSICDDHVESSLESSLPLELNPGVNQKHQGGLVAEPQARASKFVRTPAAVLSPTERRSSGNQSLSNTIQSTHISRPKVAFKPPSDMVSGSSLSTYSLWKIKEPQSQGWSLQQCPKCDGKSGNHHFLTLQVHHTGIFWCGWCGHHGNASVSPSRSRETWISIWRIFIAEHLNGVNHELPNNPSLLSQDWGNPLEILGGAWLPYLTQEGVWENRWHVWCHNEQNLIVDAYIFNSHDESWSRLPWTTPTLLGWDQLTGNKVVLVSHPLDYALLKKAGVEHVCCLPPDLDPAFPTSSVWRVLGEIEKKMSNMKELFLSLRLSDRLLEEELGRRLDRERCFRTRWRIEGDDNPEEVSPQHLYFCGGFEAIHQSIMLSVPFPVIGVYELDDLDERFENLYHTGLSPGAETGWPSLDVCYTVKPGQWTLVTGIPGHGKSTWLDALLVNLASLHGWRFGLFSPENQPVERHFASLMEKKIGKPFTEGSRPRITEEEKNSTKRWLNDKFKVILPDEENGLWTLDAVLKLAKTLVYRYGIRGLVIDPWNEIDHSTRGNNSETNHISESLTKIRRFARLYDVHVWIVAHPTKLEKKADGKYPVATPYDVAGGAHWRNKADNAICVYRNPDEDDFDVSDIYIQKIRFREVGKIGMVSLRSELGSGRYIDDIDQTKRSNSIKSGKFVPSTSLVISSPRQYHHQAPVLGYENHDVF